MNTLLATLCLNEMEWLPRLYKQHKDWSGLQKWVFVEAADERYLRANPKMVSKRGLSVDGTSEYLERLSKEDDRIVYIPYGLSKHADPAQGKCQCRQRYLDIASELKPDFVITLDADEFYPLNDQRKLNSHLERLVRGGKTGIVLPYRNIWHPPSIANQPLFQWEIVGILWRVVVCKVWRWRPGTKYKSNHNSPEHNGILLNKNLKRLDRISGSPCFVHMGFASKLETRIAKNRYYVERGEGRTDHRGSYVKSRASFEKWKPGARLPNKDRLIRYTGPIPEVFFDEC